MNQILTTEIGIQNIRQLAEEFTSNQLDQCQNEQIQDHTNSCKLTGETTEILNGLARAAVIRKLIDEGASLPEAMRELGRRMRGFSYNN